MGINFSKQYEKTQKAVEQKHREVETLKLQEQRLAERLVTASICREFEDRGVTCLEPTWYMDRRGKLMAAH